MFYYIKGKMVLNEDSTAVIDAGGVAYAMTVSANTQAAISSKSFNGETEVQLFTHLSVREDGVDLFGFMTKDELHMFKLLTSVSGIGPKAAMAILSHMTPDSIAFAICTDDKKAISKAPGIGPKTAARVILELKDKMQKSSSSAPVSEVQMFAPANNPGKYAEAVDALTVLGFQRTVADDVLKTLDISSMELEDIIRESLKKLMK